MADPYLAQPKDTIFTFFDHVFNISLLERLMAAGEIQTEAVALSVYTVAAAARLETYQFEQDENGQWSKSQVEDGSAVGVKMDHVMSLTKARKVEPVLLVELPNHNADDGPDSVLIDGLHRTARHIIDGDESMTVAVISMPEDIIRFHFHRDGGRTRDILGRPIESEKIQVRYYWAGQ